MVGALADWFAVTALFRHPLGLPIPHTAIIPTQEGPARRHPRRLRRRELPLRGRGARPAAGASRSPGASASWLGQAPNADRVTAELATAAARRAHRAARRRRPGRRRRGDHPPAPTPGSRPPLGKMLERVARRRRPPPARRPGLRPRPRLAGGDHDSVAADRRARRAGWTPRFVDRQLGDRVYKELLRFATEMRDRPGHPARGASTVPGRLRRRPAADTDTRAGRADQARCVGRPEVQELIAQAWASVDAHARRRPRTSAASCGCGSRAACCARRAAARGRRLRASRRLAGGGRRLRGAALPREITSLITDTVARWDAEHTSRKIEAAHRPRPAVHPDQRHGGRRAGRPADLHGLAAVFERPQPSRLQAGRVVRS